MMYALFGRLEWTFLRCLVAIGSCGWSWAHSQTFSDKVADADALPSVPEAFTVVEFAREPLVRQPSSMAFDARGRLMVGMGPQYRHPTRETPGDSVVLVLDNDSDGVADETRIFAKGFNSIQALAWRGDELWIANAPDLTVVRDLDGDDAADEYIRLYTDLGNLEHGLHGLTFAPDGKLYMSKGNSKGLSQPGRYAPKAFRDLWGVTVPAEVPDFPPPVRFTREDYQRNYHDPADDWGMDGGVLRCNRDGSQLEIVARGFRNPWDMAMDSGFHWLGTDNDQTQGDRVFMAFDDAHFGWNHPWSSHWSTAHHPMTAPVSGPLFEGSGTGVVFGDSPAFPAEYRGVFFINDWLQKTTYLWKPEWDGALLRPASGNWVPFVSGGKSLYRPTDLEFGPDGALWVLGWSSGYGAEWDQGDFISEGRIFRVAWKAAPKAQPIVSQRSLAEFSLDALIEEFSSPLPVRRIDAQDELVRRHPQVQPALLQRLVRGQLSEAQETWCVWALGRMPSWQPTFNQWLFDALEAKVPASLNLRLQALRILARSTKQPSSVTTGLENVLRQLLDAPEPRLRFAAVQAFHQVQLPTLIPELLDCLDNEADVTVRYAGWRALRRLATPGDLRVLLGDPRAGVRLAALLGLLDSEQLETSQVVAIQQGDTDASIRQVAERWLAKAAMGREQVIRGKPLQSKQESAGGPPPQAVSSIERISHAGPNLYRVVASGMTAGQTVYSDRNYRLTQVPGELQGYDLIQTANADDDSSGTDWLRLQTLVPVRVWVGVDLRQAQPPRWIRDHFPATALTAAIDEGAKFRFYQRAFPAGEIVLGGNTEDGVAGGKGNYLVAVAPAAFPSPAERSTLESVLACLDQADPRRGELWFRHQHGAGCVKCHSLDASTHGFGPGLMSIGSRSNVRHIIQSIVDPSRVITEGFQQWSVLTESGQVYSGILLDESGFTLSLGLSSGERVDIPKSQIEERTSSKLSAMPDMSETITPLQVADLAAFLMTKTNGEGSGATAKLISQAVVSSFSFQTLADRVEIRLAGEPVASFVFRDPQIRRPYFANLRLPGGVQVTRRHPPVEGKDAMDHDTMHPGLWLGFGDLNGDDFWRNQGSIEHQRFLVEPQVDDGHLVFATECRLVSRHGEILGHLQNRYRLLPRPVRGINPKGGEEPAPGVEAAPSPAWLLIWEATLLADRQPLILGDQEEMGFGARVATVITEQNGGRLLNSAGKRTAAETWGQAADWCDYAGTVGGEAAGITLMADRNNFRTSWWHNRDYGVFVANPFGRQAMKQGDKSLITIDKGQSLSLRFGALIHHGLDMDGASEFEAFLKSAR
jgi:putative membrane-bound dehydrogenase-like protein